jgi:acetyl-CoA C-acetyltransferase
VPAARKVLDRAGLRIDDIDIFEVNEAFAVVPLFFMDQLKVPGEKVNANGGAIAMGHPLGATGAMILGHCLDELERMGGRYGLITLCTASGMATAAVIERV